MNVSATCPIDGSSRATAAALRETERFAQATGLVGKQALHLRLLAEELLGVINGVAKVRDGSFFIEEEDEYRLQLSAKTFPVGEMAQQRLLGASSTGENAFYQGVSGKLRMVADWYSRGTERSEQENLYVGAGFASHVPEEWSLVRMRNRLAREKKAAEWDELEVSILSRLADDVRVGLRRDKVAITVYKKFNGQDA